MKISICVNLDSRDGFQHPDTVADTMFNGCRSIDFMLEGLENKRAFFKGFHTELVAFIDEHLEITDTKLSKIRDLVDVLVIRKHSNDHLENDWNYWRALAMCSGDIISHFDGDMAAFTASPEPIQQMINWLETYSYISYPSFWSPNAVTDPRYDYQWVSTRFFMCKKETIDFTEFRKMLTDYDYMYSEYPASVRDHWAEHAIGLHAKYKGNGVFYPPVDLDQYAIFSWDRYKSGTFKMLNDLPYEKVKEFINQRGLHYPCDLSA